jgi:hypothetical protein
MSARMQTGNTRQDGNFNIKGSESINGISYSFVQLPMPNWPWIDNNIRDINSNVEDITNTTVSLCPEDNEKADILLAVQDSTPDTVVDDTQYIRLKTMLQEEITETGITNPSEEIVESLYSEDKRKANILLNELFLKNFHDPHIIIGVLHIISHFDYDLVSPEGPTMAIAALTHKDVEAREYGVKCFENWQHKDGIGILEQIKANERWLQNYINLVIRDLKNT